MKPTQIAAFGCVAFFAAQRALAEDGIPQMDQSWFANQLFWLAVSFVLLYVVVARVIAPTVGGVLTARDTAITLAIAEAEEAKRTAESTRGDFESASKAARMQAAELMATAQAQNSAELAEAMAKLDHDLARKTEQAQTRIADAVLKAESGLTAASTALAATLVAKLLGGEPGESAAPKRRAKA